jgi:putative transport protein
MFHSIGAELAQNPILTLFVVIGLGYLLGELNLFTFRLGVAGVLFMGIAVGALSPDIHIPEAVASLGLILFVYTLGIQSGPAFFDSFRKKGSRDTLLAVIVLVIGFLMTLGAARMLHLTGPKAAGMYAGSLTSTPTLAAVRDRVKELATGRQLPADQVQAVANEPVVAYGVTYPVGVIGVLLLFQITRKLWRVEFKEGGRGSEIRIRDFVVENPGAVGRKLQDVMRHHKEPGFVISRIQRGAALPELPTEETVLARGDVLAVVGGEEGLERAGLMFGAETESQIELDRTRLDNRRFLVSSRAVVGKRLGELKMPLNANITRIRRGDVELIPTHDTRLEYGDSVRVVTERENFPAMSQFFGDSIRGTAEAQFGSVAIGLVLGVLAGMFPIPIPGGQVLRLGLAGGPLLVAMLLGKLERTGSITWTMPASANLTLRQIGSVLFLAGVGTNAGYNFESTVRTSGLQLLIAGAVITVVVHVIVLVAGYKWLKIPFDYLMGLSSGIQTQMACVAFADEASRSDEPNVAYASIYPVAMITKIILAQLLL